MVDLLEVRIDSARIITHVEFQNSNYFISVTEVEEEQVMLHINGESRELVMGDTSRIAGVEVTILEIRESFVRISIS